MKESKRPTRKKDTKVSMRGGAREGAGRPPKEECMVRVVFHCTRRDAVHLYATADKEGFTVAAYVRKQLGMVAG